MAAQARGDEHAHDPVLAREHDAVFAEQRRSARAEVCIARVELFLIGRREGLTHAQAGHRELDHAVAEAAKAVSDKTGLPLFYGTPD